MLTKFSKYGPLNSHDILKFIALIIMVVDHIGLFIFPENETLRAIGRACIPIWFFFIGFYKPSKTAYDLYFFALAITIIKYFYDADFKLDILVTFIIVRILIDLSEKYKLPKQHFLIPYLLAVLFTPLSLTIISYGSVGFLLAYCGYLKRINHLNTKYHFIGASIFYITTQQIIFGFDIFNFGLMCFLTALTTWLVFNYKNKSYNISLTPVMVLARYSLVFYFIHLVILMLINLT